MTSTTKRGFHLPWSGDGRGPDESADGQETKRPDAPQAQAGQRGVPVGELGRGPFSLAPGDTIARKTDPLVEDQESRRPVPNRGAPKEASTAVSNPQMSWPGVDRSGSVTHRASAAALPPARQAFVVDEVDGVDDVDDVEGPSPRPSRRDNPLVVGLVRAMRDAARASREETTARMRAEATARIDEIRVGSADEAVVLRKRSDDDAIAIREWSKAEIARIRDEAEKRIAERREQLARETEAHASEIERLVEQVQEVATTFEADMEQFFEVLLAEQDPARVAALAEQVPDAPIFDSLPPLKRAQGSTRSNGISKSKVPAGRSSGPKAGAEPGDAAKATSAEADTDTESVAGDDPQARLEPAAAAAAEAEAIAGLDPDQAAADESTSSSLETVIEAPPKVGPPEDLSPEEIVGLLGIDTGSADDAADHAATGAPESAPPAGYEETRLMVSGLTSVAGISAFKGALGRVPGVTNVSVSSGVDDDFVFAVTHASTADLRRAVPAFRGFGAQMTLDYGEIISFVVMEPG
jgi:hypothetical protein